MNFEQWWNTLTIKEQSLIGKNNAQYVWESACEECAKVCEEFGEIFANMSQAWRNGCSECAIEIRARMEKE